MRTLIHVSDLHFGRIDRKIANQMVKTFINIKPDMVVVSGDFTQRAKIAQFISARSFLNNFKKANIKYFAVPGNHDVEPFSKPINRIFKPFHTYKKYISEDLEPMYCDDEIALAGINTARASNLKNGNINLEQMEKVTEWFKTLSRDITKIIVTHHPLDLPTQYKAKKIIHKAGKIIKHFSAQSIDVYLSGHYHRSSIITTAERYGVKDYSAIAVQAGTISTRSRGEMPSFNVLTIDKKAIQINTCLWNADEKSFGVSSSSQYKLNKGVWKVVS